MIEAPLKESDHRYDIADDTGTSIDRCFRVHPEAEAEPSPLKEVDALEKCLSSSAEYKLHEVLRFWTSNSKFQRLWYSEKDLYHLSAVGLKISQKWMT